MHNLHDLEALLRARSPLIFCNSADEQRVLTLIADTALRLGRDAWCWTCVKGLYRMQIESSPQFSLSDAEKLVPHISKLSIPGVFAVLDFHPYLDQPRLVRQLKEFALEHEVHGHSIVLISHEIGVPKELRSLSVSFSPALPTRSEIAQTIREEVRTYLSTAGRSSVKADPESVELLINSLQGLPASDVQRLARAAIVDDGVVNADDLVAVHQTKRALLQHSGVLEYEYDTAEFADVAGLNELKRWLQLRERVMRAGEAPEGLTPPKGILLLGVQGCGKSLAAKAVAGSWKLPLLRLDMGSVFNKYMGETERRIREALENAETLAPCVLWIDELEKGIASTDFDGGTAQRVLGTLLTWMAERKSKVFLVATANNVDTLPPELLRKGRFDEIFFVDLPNTSNREELFRIHLRRRGLRADDFKLEHLAAVTEGFSGAEIEQLIVGALYAAEAIAALRTEHLAAEAARTRPLSRIMAEKIAQLRSWAAERCVPAD